MGEGFQGLKGTILPVALNAGEKNKTLSTR